MGLLHRRRERAVRFDVVFTNPPFQDSVRRKRTPHKLWIDFTAAALERFLAEGGSLVQVSPSSFGSPHSPVLGYMREYQTMVLRLDTGRHFPGVGSTFADYWIVKRPNHGNHATEVVGGGGEHFRVALDRGLAYLPNDLSAASLGIHRKVVLSPQPRLPVSWDYATCHNAKRRTDPPVLVAVRDDGHPYPVLHTNRTTWYSSVRQEWAGRRKVMWSASGRTAPFYDDGLLGGTDMVYYTEVRDAQEGAVLAANLNSLLLRYIYRTAKWSGFGSKYVFTHLPDLPRERVLAEGEMAERFGLTEEEREYAQRVVGGVGGGDR